MIVNNHTITTVDCVTLQVGIMDHEVVVISIDDSIANFHKKVRLSTSQVRELREQLQLALSLISYSPEEL